MKINALTMQILMGERNWTIKKLAEESQVSRQTISCIKAGKSCSPQVAYRIAEALGISLTELLQKEENGWKRSYM